MRTLDSHLAYYERWAKNREFQALLKARPLAGDRDLGGALRRRAGTGHVEQLRPRGFVESVQRMRERVAHIPDDEIDVQLKLGPGGLRDIEFTVQLLQLVHGQSDESVRQLGTLPALVALADGGYIGRVEAAEFSQDCTACSACSNTGSSCSGLRRTHLMPRDADALRVLARASGLASTATELSALRASGKLRVRGLHERLFYRPLLSAVAALPAEGSTSRARRPRRLAAIGFLDPRGALAHIAALTAGERRATIQRHLLPVMLQWFADGADPDYGLLAFRRLSDSLVGTHWFLRMLRDPSGAAER